MSDWERQSYEVLKAELVPNLKHSDPCLLVASSMGAYISLLLMRDRTDLMEAFSGCVLMCPAIDFPIFKLEDLTDQEYEQYRTKGEFSLNLSKNSNDPKILRLRKELIIDAKKKIILSGPQIDVNFPLRVL